MSNVEAIRRQLKIKSGVASRLAKEHNLYRQEAEEQKLKVDKLVADNAEEWYIKNGRNMLTESNKMIDDSASRLGKAVGELRDLIVSVRGDKEFPSDDPNLASAEEALEMASI